MLRILFLIASSLIFISRNTTAQYANNLDISISQAEKVINYLRSKSCHCGHAKKYPVTPVSWDDKLSTSSQAYASEMARTKRFSHTGSNGSNVGNRIDKAGYYWQYVGENIAEGYDTFRDVVLAWMKSPDHCKLIMDGRMQHFAVSKYKSYWVLHMATPMPRGKKRTNVRID